MSLQVFQGLGNATFNATAAARSMTWRLHAAAHLDYIVVAPSTTAIAAKSASFDLLKKFTSWVGRSPGLPDYALGYWHSKNRYASQKDLLAAAHGFANRSIPVDVIVIDWLHWRVQGDWHFDEDFWPDPTAMVKELASLNMEVMVTVW